MTVMSLVAVVALCTGKIIKNDASIFERGEKTKWYHTLCLDSVNRQKLRWKVRI